MRLAAASLLLALATAGCATSGTNGSAPPAYAGSSPSERRATVLLQDEIEKTQLSTLYDVVKSLRPRWMQTRGMDSLRRPTEIQVYVGGQHVNGGLEALREMTALGVAKVEFFDPAQATARWGTGHGEGAILVTLSTR